MTNQVVVDVNNDINKSYILMAHRDGKLNSYRHSPSFHFTSWGQHCSIYVHVLYFSQQVYQWDKSNHGYGEVQANKQGVERALFKECLKFKSQFCILILRSLVWNADMFEYHQAETKKKY